MTFSSTCPLTWYATSPSFKTAPLASQGQLHTGACHGHVPSTSARVKLRAAVATDLQHPLKGAQGGDRE